MRGGMPNNFSQAHNVPSPSRRPPRDDSPDPPVHVQYSRHLLQKLVLWSEEDLNVMYALHFVVQLSTSLDWVNCLSNCLLLHLNS
jgi:hypothetical protein